jgi:hypothetical protein
MDFKIFPLKGVNEIKFGMHADLVHKIMRTIPDKFRRHDEKFPSDHYIEEGAFCYYDDDGHLEAMEFTRPSRALLGKIDLLDLSFSQAADLLRKIDNEAIAGDEMITSERLSLSIWSPAGFDEADEPVGAVLAGRPGYYSAAG